MATRTDTDVKKILHGIEENKPFKQVFYVNSRNRISGTTSNFNHILRLRRDVTQTHILLISALIPKTYYGIQAGQNTFTVIENGVNKTVTITPANYTRRSFQAELTTQLAAVLSYTYVISYPSSSQPDTGKFTFTVSANIDQPTFVMPNNNLAEFMGFEKGSSNVFSADTLTSTNVIRIQREDVLLIHTNIVSNNVDTFDDVLAEVYSSNVQTLDNISYFSGEYGDMEALTKRIRDSKNYSYNFYITDENNQPIDLNGNNIVLQIAVW